MQCWQCCKYVVLTALTNSTPPSSSPFEATLKGLYARNDFFELFLTLWAAAQCISHSTAELVSVLHLSGAAQELPLCMRQSSCLPKPPANLQVYDAGVLFGADKTSDEHESGYTNACCTDACTSINVLHCLACAYDCENLSA
jgi:hypothetical protein